MSALDILLSETRYNVYRFPADFDFSSSLPRRSYFSLTYTPDETSLVISTAHSSSVPDHTDRQLSGPWSMMRIRGPLEHSMTGVLHRLAGPLRDARVPIFALSTFDTDYVLVPDDKRSDAVDALEKDGWKVVRTD